MKEELKKINLPSGKEIQIVTYIEAGVIIDLPNETNKTEFLLKSFVKSLEGSDKEVYERIRKLTIKDYQFIDDELAKLFNQEGMEGLKV